MKELNYDFNPHLLQDTALVNTLEIEGVPNYYVLKNKQVVCHGNLKMVMQYIHEQDK